MGNFFSASIKELEAFSTEPFFKEAARRRKKEDHKLRNVLLGAAGVALGAGAYYGASKGMFGAQAQGVAKSVGSAVRSGASTATRETKTLANSVKRSTQPLIDRIVKPYNAAANSKINNFYLKRFSSTNPGALAPLGKLKLPPGPMRAPDTLFRFGTHLPKV